MDAKNGKKHSSKNLKHQTTKFAVMENTLPACFPGRPQAAGAPPSAGGAVQPSPLGGGSCQTSPPRTPERESFSGSPTSTAAGPPHHQLR